MTGADLTGARLQRADLGDADLTGADLTGADLGGAKLTGAEGVPAAASGPPEPEAPVDLAAFRANRNPARRPAPEPDGPPPL